MKCSFSKKQLVLTITFSGLFYFLSGFIVASILFGISTNFLFSLIQLLVKRKVISEIKIFTFLISSVSFVYFIKTFIITIYHIPSKSMENLLFVDDYVLIDQFSTGSHFYKNTLDCILMDFCFSNNERSNPYDIVNTVGKVSLKNKDVIVFSDDLNSQMKIKRIFGISGELIELKNGRVFLDKKLLPEIETSKKALPKDRAILNPLVFNSSWSLDNVPEIKIPKKGLEIILDKNSIYYKTVLKYEDSSLSLAEKQSITYTFKNDYYFVLGDNRDNSIDSRIFGFIPAYSIKGKMIFNRLFL